MRSIIFAITIASGTFFCSCEKELDMNYHDIDPVPVIEATLTQDGARVSVTETTPMNQAITNTKLTDATITLTDSESGATTILSTDDSGYYTSSTQGITGHTYTLSVSRAGATYTATSTMTAPVEIISVEFEWVQMPYDKVAILQVSFTDDPTTQGDCYWVRVYRNGEAYAWSPVTDVQAVDGRIDQVMMTTRMDIDEEDAEDLLIDGDQVTVSVTPISRTMYDYLIALSTSGSNGPALFTIDSATNTGSNGSNGSASSTNSATSTNSSNSTNSADNAVRVLGYFLASPVTTASITFSPTQFPGY